MDTAIATRWWQRPREGAWTGVLVASLVLAAGAVAIRRAGERHLRVAAATVTTVAAECAGFRDMVALAANLIAWPVAWFVMQRWLDGYAYRIAMPWWLLPAAGALALGVAIAGIAATALAAPRRHPIAALRDE